MIELRRQEIQVGHFGKRPLGRQRCVGEGTINVGRKQMRHEAAM
jgi:hypothetical protein